MGRERGSWKNSVVWEEKYGGYLKPTAFEVPKPCTKSKPVVSDIKRKRISKKSNISKIHNPQVSTVYEDCKSSKIK